MKPASEMTIAEMQDEFRGTWLSDERVQEIISEVEFRRSRDREPGFISQMKDAMEGRR